MFRRSIHYLQLYSPMGKLLAEFGEERNPIAG
jgi:hypothetical protein